MIELCFPEETQLVIENIKVDQEKLNVYARSGAKMVSCPDCQIESNKPHSHYQRRPQDLPCFGRQTQLHLTVRRFFCGNQLCPRRTFAEPFPCLLARKARRTQRLKQKQLTVAFAMSGEEGCRVLAALGMPLSGDTLIRDIRETPDVAHSTPRVLGIDDWAKLKGRSYGTILVDLESQQVVDLLDS